VSLLKEHDFNSSTLTPSTTTIYNSGKTQGYSHINYHPVTAQDRSWCLLQLYDAVGKQSNLLIPDQEKIFLVPAKCVNDTDFYVFLSWYEFNEFLVNYLMGECLRPFWSGTGACLYHYCRFQYLNIEGSVPLSELHGRLDRSAPKRESHNSAELSNSQLRRINLFHLRGGQSDQPILANSKLFVKVLPASYGFRGNKFTIV